MEAFVRKACFVESAESLIDVLMEASQYKLLLKRFSRWFCGKIYIKKLVSRLFF